MSTSLMPMTGIGDVLQPEARFGLCLDERLHVLLRFGLPVGWLCETYGATARVRRMRNRSSRVPSSSARDDTTSQAAA